MARYGDDDGEGDDAGIADAGNEALRALSVELNAARRCTRCRTLSSELHNMGTLQCAWHPGDVQLRIGGGGDASTPPGAYTCCGRRPARAGMDRGCVRCDHTFRRDGRHELDVSISVRDASILFPADMLRRLHAQARAGTGLVTLSGNGTQMFRIRRMDVAAANVADAGANKQQ